MELSDVRVELLRGDLRGPADQLRHCEVHLLRRQNNEKLHEHVAELLQGLPGRSREWLLPVIERLRHGLPMCQLLVVLVLAAGCDRVFPYSAAADSYVPRDLPIDRRPAVDGSGGRDVSKDRAVKDVVKADRAVRDVGKADRAVDAKKVDHAVKADLAKDTATPDGTNCTTWAGWSCPSFASYYCRATCGTMQIDCDAVKCTCSVGGKTKNCANTSPTYCKGCQDALVSGCCQ